MIRTAREAGIALALGVSLATTAPAAASQAFSDTLLSRPLATRGELETLANRLAERDDRSALLAHVRTRLAAGDFRPGDRVLVQVQGESTLTDTFTVRPDTTLQLPSPAVGLLPLRGVLRVELEERVEHHVSRFVRGPVVRARPLLQVSVQGEVVRAGYHGIPADAALVEVLTAAGGTTQEADMDDFRLERDGKKLLAGPDLQRALSERRTLNDVGIRDGDRFVIPRDGGGGVMDRLRFLWVVVSITGGVYGLSRAF